MKPAAQAILNYYSECASDQPHPQYMEGLKAAMNIVEALPLESESLALLRELNDALVVPGWLQPRVDAVLDGVEPRSRSCEANANGWCGQCAVWVSPDMCKKRLNDSQPQEEK